MLDLETLLGGECDSAHAEVVLALEGLDPGVGPGVDLQVGELGELLAAVAAGVLHDLVVDLVLVPGQRVLGREDSAALAAVKLGRLLVDRLDVSFQGLGVTVNLDKHHVKSKT